MANSKKTHHQIDNVVSAEFTMHINYLHSNSCFYRVIREIKKKKTLGLCIIAAHSVQPKKGTTLMLSVEQLEIANLIIEAVNLEDIEASEIDPQAPIFNNGLGLDSIDALEISLALSKKYGIKIKSSDKNINDIFSSVAVLTDFVQANK